MVADRCLKQEEQRELEVVKAVGRVVTYEGQAAEEEPWHLNQGLVVSALLFVYFALI